MLKKIALFVALMVVSVSTVSHTPSNRDLTSQSLRADATRIGLCQAIMRAGQIRILTTIRAMQLLKVNPGPIVEAELTDGVDVLKENYGDFTKHFNDVVRKRAVINGVNEVELMELREQVERDALRGLQAHSLKGATLIEQSTLVYAKTLELPILKCVNWYLKEQKALNL